MVSQFRNRDFCFDNRGFSIGAEEVPTLSTLVSTHRANRMRTRKFPVFRHDGITYPLICIPIFALCLIAESDRHAERGMAFIYWSRPRKCSCCVTHVQRHVVPGERNGPNAAPKPAVRSFIPVCEHHDVVLLKHFKSSEIVYQTKLGTLAVHPK